MNIKNYDNTEIVSTQVKRYAGIGSRRINNTISLLHIKIAFYLALEGYHMESGGADGTDTSYEFGVLLAHRFLQNNRQAVPVSSLLTVHLPWKDFNGRKGYDFYNLESPIEAFKIASEIHPNWDRLGRAARAMMARNTLQVLSKTCDNPIKFVSCHTPDGAKLSSNTSSKTGGTGQAIRLANNYNIPVFNTGNPEDFKRLSSWVVKKSEEFSAVFKTDINKFIEHSYLTYSPFDDSVDGNIIKEFDKSTIDVLVQGCNCFNKQGKGLALSIKNKYLDAYKSDLNTRPGDKSKLGTYTKADFTVNGRKQTIINAYTQYRYSNDNDLNVDYEMVRKVFKQINADFYGKTIGVPKIGSGLASGCWVTVSNIIKTELSNCKVKYVRNERDMEKVNAIEQSSFDI